MGTIVDTSKRENETTFQIFDCFINAAAVN